MNGQDEWVDVEMDPDPWGDDVLSEDISDQIEALDLGSVLTDPVVARLRAAYNEGPRRYHNWKHAVHTLNAIFPLQYSDDQRRDLAIAALFHDAVYVPGSKDNERRSAEMARKLLPGYKRMSKVENLIAATAVHGSHNRWTTLDITRDFLDCDILSVTFEWDRFVAINNAIIAEYLTVFPAALVGIGRNEFLENWLRQPTIFLGEWYGRDGEWAARCNIERLLNVRKGRHPGEFE